MKQTSVLELEPISHRCARDKDTTLCRFVRMRVCIECTFPSRFSHRVTLQTVPICFCNSSSPPPHVSVPIPTLVTPMMLRTSPLQKGRSCSVVPWKLYLATHSVPGGHGVCTGQGGNRGTSLHTCDTSIHSFHITINSKYVIWSMCRSRICTV